jgi:hypothetical protein
MRNLEFCNEKENVMLVGNMIKIICMLMKE